MFNSIADLWQDRGIAASTVLSLVASAIFLVRLLPQPLRLARSGVADGVSAMAALTMVVSVCAWLIYGVIAGLLVVWVVSVVALVPAVWTVALLRRQVGIPDAAAALAMAAVIVAAGITGTLAGVLAGSVLVTSGPQVWKAVRQRDLSGIAPATWRIAIADALSWGAYGFVIHDPALQGYCVVLLASAIIVLGRLRWVGMTVEPATT